MLPAPALGSVSFSSRSSHVSDAATDCRYADVLAAFELIQLEAQTLVAADIHYALTTGICRHHELRRGYLLPVLDDCGSLQPTRKQGSLVVIHSIAMQIRLIYPCTPPIARSALPSQRRALPHWCRYVHVHDVASITCI